MIPLIKTGLRDRRNSIVGWSLGLSAYIALNILVYSSIGAQAKSLNQALDNLPPAAKALFGSNGDFLSPVGYLNSKLYYLILPLLFAMLAITLSSHLLAREEENKTIELILARPVSRLTFWVSKLVAGFIVVAAVGAISLIVTVICLKSTNYDIAISHVVAATIMTLILSLLFGAVAWAVNGIGRFGRRASVAIAWFTVLGSYLFTSLEGFAHWLRWPAKLLPYHYYQPADILNGHFTWVNAIGMLIAALIILTIGYLGFRRRDIA